LSIFLSRDANDPAFFARVIRTVSACSGPTRAVRRGGRWLNILSRFAEHPVDRILPSLRIEIAVAVHTPIMRCLDQAEEQRDGEKHCEAVKPIADFWIYPRRTRSK